MNRYWISWYSTTPMGAWELHSPWWITGHRRNDYAKTVCAAVIAPDQQAAEAMVYAAYDVKPREIEWRFCEKRADDWEPFNERFPRADWMVWP